MAPFDMDADNSRERKAKDFTYLNNLISSGAREINLDCDIVLSDHEAANYQYGIEIKRSDLIINGNGHIIDARHKASIFLNHGRNIQIKNTSFKNGFSHDGSGVLINYLGDMEISNCIFSNNVSQIGTLVNMGDMKIRDSLIENNKSYYAGGINNQDGNLEISNCRFIRNAVQNNSGALDIEGGFADINNCEFRENTSGRIGGAIFTISKIRCRNSKFISNQAEFDGGAINSQPGAVLELSNTEFLNNKSDRNGGAIANMGQVDIKDSLFKDNHAGTDGGAINCQPDGIIKNNEELINETSENPNIYKSTLSISKSKFIANKSKDIGGAITNWSKTVIDGCIFESNESSHGGAINNQPGGRLGLREISFEKNFAKKIGACISNYGQLKGENAIFKNNITDGDGGAINNQPGSSMEIEICEFRKNRADNGTGGAVSNWGDAKLENGIFDNNLSKKGLSIFNRSSIHVSNSKFMNHDGNMDIILNNDDLSVRDSIFENNKVESAIRNQEEGVLTINYGSFNDNEISKAALCNIGKSCAISETIFENNKSENEYKDIYNESELSLSGPKFKNTDAKTVLNRGEASIKNWTGEDALKNISNEGQLNDLNISKKEADGFNFTYLDDLIHGNENEKFSKNIKGQASQDKLEQTNPDKHLQSIKDSEAKEYEIQLDKDIMLDENELGFYEGGIVLDVDNLTIDGCGHSIDGRNKSRLFYVTGENICLKNITFKNASFSSSYEKHSNGGGAIRTIKDSNLTLINCNFIGNYCDDDGGAILNNGSILSLNTRFKQNESKSFAGSICNNNKYESNRDFFEDNKSEIGSIFNSKNLIIKSADLSKENNSSNENAFGRAIFNNGDLNIRNTSLNLEEIVFDAGCLNIENEENEKIGEIFNNHSDGPVRKIILENNLVFDFEKEMEFKKEIDIDNDFIIEGNKHSIDMNGNSIMFNIHENASVVFKDLIIKNIDSTHPLINNKGTASFKNCRIINNSILDEPLINNNDSLILINTIFSNNQADKGLISNKKELSIIKNLFLINNCDSGPAIGNWDECGIDNSKFVGNCSKKEGASIKNELKSNLEIKNSEFKSNYGNEAGCIVNFNKASIRDSLFEDNKTENEGGAINNQIESDLTIINSRFIQNASNNEGGAVKNKGKIRIRESMFRKNNAKFDGGALFNHSGGRFDIENTSFEENNARIGGSIVNWNKIKIQNSCFKGNHAIHGAAIYTFHRSSQDILNCRFQDNISDEAGVILKDKNSYLYLDKCEFENNSPDNISETLE